MSPEQARRENHRIAGHSDIYSLGVVLYELLTGTRPFQGEEADELLERMKRDEPKPPRQRNEAIPKELERIGPKALPKRADEGGALAATSRKAHATRTKWRNGAETDGFMGKGLASRAK